MTIAGRILAEAAADGASRLREAVHRHNPLSRQGFQERFFTFLFSGLVYPQIWEDPVVDIEALRPVDGERLVAIASGGCNVLSYLTAADAPGRQAARRSIGSCPRARIHRFNKF